MTTGTSGDWARMFINGIEATADIQASLYNLNIEANPAPHENAGVHSFSPGARNDNLSFNNVYRYHKYNGKSLHELLSTVNDGATDVEFVISEARGFQKSPVAGDLGYMYDGTLHRYDPVINPTGSMTADVAFAPRGKRSPEFPRVMHLQSTGKDSFTGSVVDMGAIAVNIDKGAVAHLHVFTPTGVAASGTVTVGTNPTATDTAVIGGVTFTFVASLTGVAGQVLIGATALDSARNLYDAAILGDGNGSTYVSNGGAPTTCRYSPPTSAGVITATYKLTGTAGNSFTLAKTGSAITVSGATLSGGTAGDTFTLKLQSATSSGGSYTDRITFSANGTVALAERQEIAIGTVLDRYWRLSAVASAGNHDLGVACFLGLFHNV